FWNPRLKFLEHVQLGKVRLRLVQIVEILSAPAKRLSSGPLEPACIDSAILEDRLFFRPKVVSDHRDHAYIGEVTRRQREVSRRPAQNVGNSPRRRGN